MFLGESLLLNGFLVVNLWRFSHTESTENTESHIGEWNPVDMFL